MIYRALKVAVRSLAVLAFSLVVLGLVFIGTEPGTAWLVNTALDRANRDAGVIISFGEFSGSLLTEMRITEITVSAADDSFNASSSAATVDLNLFAFLVFTLDINRLELEGLSLTLPPQDTSQSQSADPGRLEALFELPLAVKVGRLAISPLAVDGEQKLQSLSGSIDFDNSRLYVNVELTVDPETSVFADLTLGASGFTVSGNVNWAAMIAGRQGNGLLAVAGDIYSLDIRHTLTSPLAITTTGSITTGIAGDVLPGFDLEHQFSNIKGDEFSLPVLQNLDGRVATTGTATNFMLDVTAELQLDGLGVVSVAMDAAWENDSLDIGRLALDSRNSAMFAFTASGRAAMDPAPAISLDWTLEDFSDGGLLPQLELVGVNGRGSVEITSDGDIVQTALLLDELDGSLNGYPLTGNGRVSLLNDSIRDIALTLVSDTNSIDLEGTLTPQLAVNWELAAPALDNVLTGLSGRASGSGSLTGSLEAPRINGSFTGEELVYNTDAGEFRVTTLSADAEYTGDGNDITLDFSGLSANLPDRELGQLEGRLLLSGTPASHTLSLQSRSPDFSLELEARGQYLEDAWDGTLDRVLFSSGYGDWRLQEPTTTFLSAERANIASHCWQLNDLLVCGQAGWTEAAGLEGNLSVDNYPLAFFDNSATASTTGLENMGAVLAERPPALEALFQRYGLILPENGFMEGQLDLDMTFTGLGKDWSQAMIDLTLAPRDLSLGIIRPPGLESASDEPVVERYGIDETEMTLERRDGRWLAMSGFEIYLQETGGLDFQGVFSGTLSLADDETLGGEFDLSFNNIAWVEALLPDVRNVNGQLGASGRIGGNLTRPLLMLDSSLSNGSLEIPEYGLELEGVDFTLQSDANNEISLSGTANSGDGNISLESSITTPLLSSRTVTVVIRGQDFLLVNHEDTLVTVSPDLTLDYRENELNISGEFIMPRMHLDLRNSQALSENGSVDVSRDEVLVNAPPELQKSGSPADDLIARIPVSGDVMLRVGDDVHFLGSGFDVYLTGDLSLEQAASRPLLAHGELTIPRGSYGLYGQRLQIEDGKLLFLGNPMNPALDIRAVRKTDAAEVGLLMNGTVGKIHAQLYSTPALPENEILALLITGNSFQDARNFSGAESQNMLGAIALLSLEQGQGLTGSVQKELGLDTLAISSSGTDYRDSAIGLGKYISSDIFVRYDIGLFDRANVLTLQYFLNDRLRLEVETGVSQSVDLTYTLEK